MTSYESIFEKVGKLSEEEGRKIVCYIDEFVFGRCSWEWVEYSESKYEYFEDGSLAYNLQICVGDDYLTDLEVLLNNIRWRIALAVEDVLPRPYVDRIERKAYTAILQAIEMFPKRKHRSCLIEQLLLQCEEMKQEYFASLPCCKIVAASSSCEASEYCPKELCPRASSCSATKWASYNFLGKKFSAENFTKEEQEIAHFMLQNEALEAVEKSKKQLKEKMEELERSFLLS